jgi:hypothetical protein
MSKIELASYEDFCVWLHCVSDSEPSRSRYEALSVADLMSVKSEADRIRGIIELHDARVAKAKAAAARVR